MLSKVYNFKGRSRNESMYNQVYNSGRKLEPAGVARVGNTLFPNSFVGCIISLNFWRVCPMYGKTCITTLAGLALWRCDNLDLQSCVV